MAKSSAYARIKGDVLTLVRAIPKGRVATFDAIGKHLDVMPRHVAYILTKLTEPEREIVPWHRIVAKGGAIGCGSQRDQQFALLVREGVVVSPAGIVQDLARFAVAEFPPPVAGVPANGVTELQVAAPVANPGSRSRGMKDRPR